MENIVFWHLF